MRKKLVIDRKYIAPTMPFGTSVVSYLLFEQVQPKGTARGVWLALLIGWNLLSWIVILASIVINNPTEPVFKEELTKHNRNITIG